MQCIKYNIVETTWHSCQSKHWQKIKILFYYWDFMQWKMKVNLTSNLELITRSIVFCKSEKINAFNAKNLKE